MPLRVPCRAARTVLPSVVACLPWCLLALLSVQAAPDGAAKWVEVRSGHFVVTSDAGEAAARSVAKQFEQIRELFRQTFTTLRVDTAQPVNIVVARDEATMRMLLPDQWETPGHVHPAGLYQSGEDRDYVVMRLDAQGTSALHTVYHEYTHALLHLNFEQAPLWLEEGLAEFLGNSTLGDKSSQTGTLDRGHLYVLTHNQALPMGTLFTVDNDSPYYNEATHASIFYAQSWAVMHYLLLDPDAREKRLLNRFLEEWQKSGQPVEAARLAFGDEKALGATIEKYVRQRTFQVGTVLPAPQVPAESYTTRSLSAAEVLALRGDLFVHRNMLERATPLLEEALQLEPGATAPHEAMGFYRFRQRDFIAADAEMKRAIELSSRNFLAWYCRGLLLAHDVNATPEKTEQAVKFLEEAARMNPRFAPTFDALTLAYSRSAETQGKALEAAQKAASLDPGARTYQISLSYALLNNGRPAEARGIAEKLLRTAGSEDETRMARGLIERISEEEEWQKESAEAEKFDAQHPHEEGLAPGANPLRATRPEFPAVERRRLGPPEWMAADGVISAVDCSRSPEIMLTMALEKGPLTLHIRDFEKIGVSGVSPETTPDVESCKSWPGRKMKIRFHFVQGEEYLGEVLKIYFY